MKTPNPEQKRAIEHQGGVLLSAGAGSGKTFVLVEHLVYLLKTFKEEHTQLPSDQLARELRQYLSTLVFMTFTKKAAGELALRMKKRIHDEGEASFWKAVEDALPSLTVSTIHGFCFKLLAGGYFTQLDPKPVIISEFEVKKRLELLMREWFELETEKKTPGLEVLVANSASLLDALQGIFSSSELRLSWKELKVGDLASKGLDSFWEFLIKDSHWEELFEPPFVLESFHGVLNEKQMAYLEEFSKIVRHHKLTDLQGFEAFFQFARKTSPQFRNKENLGSLASYLESLSDFRAFLKEHVESLIAYFENKDGAFLLWPKLLKELFDYTEENYLRYSGFSFSDLEYYVLSGLRDSEIASRIRKDYSYFVIDEFQDTSPGQYEIVKTILAGDFSKLFVVGDMKQAIYGFRGGELGVFKECQKQIPLQLSLKNNYRSFQNVIKFNNELFGDLLHRGENYMGSDPFSVDVEAQNIPTEYQVPLGKISKTQIDLDLVLPEGEKLALNTSDYAQIEAQGLLKRIEEIQTEHPDERICLLYKKLAPAQELVGLLLKKKIPFSAQMKVLPSEDPLLSLFLVLLEQVLSKGELKEDSPLYLIIESHFKLLGFALPENWKKTVEGFYEDKDIYGLAPAFKKWLLSLGIANSNFENNLALIETLCQAGQDQIDGIALMLSKSQKSYSLDFRSGENSQSLVMMTAHASKGLEFDHVLLAGIHAHSRAMSDEPYIGKFPGSFKWKKDSQQKKPYRSPEFIVEKLITKRKEFSESKRLFYVATTRAKKALYWMDIRFQKEGLCDRKNDWVHGFRKFEEETLYKNDELSKILSQGQKTLSLPWEVSEFKPVKNPRPLFHKDNMGLEKLPLPELGFFGISGELSVTRLATICDCSRKFYLKNICRFSDDELALLGSTLRSDEKILYEERSLDEGPSSSMKRGSEIHLMISQMIKDGLSLPQDRSPKELAMLNWLKGVFPSKGRFISEEQIKFPLAGLMVSGTPDLVILGEGEDFSIWDFKTGKRHPETERAYWFQLYAYAHAFFEFSKVGGTSVSMKKMELVLAYVDEQKTVVEKKNHLEVLNELFAELQKVVHLSQVNKEHCTRCPFSVLCG